jgi:vacuolar iron transporter family protein
MYIKKYLSEFVYGATDGTITTFAIIAGTIGAQLSPAIVVILGFSNVMADGFSMASSNYLASKSEKAMGVGNGKEPLKTALATFVSFILVGSIPVIPFLISIFVPSFAKSELVVACVATGIAFIVIGAIKGHVTNKSMLDSATETFLIGGFAAFIAFYVGRILANLLGV